MTATPRWLPCSAPSTSSQSPSQWNPWTDSHALSLRSSGAGTKYWLTWSLLFHGPILPSWARVVGRPDA